MLPEDVIIKLLCYVPYFNGLNKVLKAIFPDPKYRKAIKYKIYKIKLVKKETFIYEMYKHFNSRCNDYGENFYFRQEIYYIDGKRHREDDLPALIEFDCMGKECCKKWYKNGFLYRKNGPAAIDNNGKNGMMWIKNTKKTYGKPNIQPDRNFYHRDGGKPAFYRKISIDGKIQIVIEWFINNILHRDGNKPAKIQQYYDGEKIKTQYFYRLNGHKYRQGEIFYNIPIIENEESFD